MNESNNWIDARMNLFITLLNWFDVRINWFLIHLKISFIRVFIDSAEELMLSFFLSKERNNSESKILIIKLHCCKHQINS
jgi:hypothetical protein